MNYLLITFVILLTGRFFCFKESRRLSGWRFLTTSGFFLVVFLASFKNPQALGTALGVLFIILHGIVYLIERRLNRASPAWRTITLILTIPIVYAAFQSWPLYGQQPRLAEIPTEWLALSIAALLCLKESNYVIRWFFRHYRLVEKVASREDAPSTENGRVIGYLERLLLLLFLWEGAPLAATFIVAVKGLARFKKMEEHQAFAEYVIIGTFLSVLLTLVIYKLTSTMMH